MQMQEVMKEKESALKERESIPKTETLRIIIILRKRGKYIHGGKKNYKTPHRFLK